MRRIYCTRSIVKLQSFFFIIIWVTLNLWGGNELESWSYPKGYVILCLCLSFLFHRYNHDKGVSSFPVNEIFVSCHVSRSPYFFCHARKEIRLLHLIETCSLSVLLLSGDTPHNEAIKLLFCWFCCICCLFHWRGKNWRFFFILLSFLIYLLCTLHQIYTNSFRLYFHPLVSFSFKFLTNIVFFFNLCGNHSVVQRWLCITKELFSKEHGYALR